MGPKGTRAGSKDNFLILRKRQHQARKRGGPQGKSFAQWSYTFRTSLENKDLSAQKPQQF